jgi:RNA polymerase sigma-70 factor, ECF subfamily
MVKHAPAAKPHSAGTGPDSDVASGECATTPPADERDAVLRCRSGDRNAFRLIVERYGDLLFGTAHMMVGDRDLAEDQVQEALVSAWKRIDSFDVDRPLRPWLLRVLVNQILQHRRRKLLGVIPLGEEVTRVPSLDIGPDLAVEKRLTRDALRDALADLPPDEYRVIVLRYYAEIPLHEIAEVLEIPQGTVKSRLHRARGRLREHLKRTGFSFEEDHS